MKMIIHKDPIHKAKMLWNTDEDNQLRELVQVYGNSKSWSELVKLFPGRSADQLRKRWHYKLNVHQRDDEWRSEEDELILKLHLGYGNQWVKISKSLEGRSGAKVKERFYFLAKKMSTEQRMTGLPTENVASNVKTINSTTDNEATASSFPSCMSSCSASPIPSSNIYDPPACSQYFTQLFSAHGSTPTALIIPQVSTLSIPPLMTSYSFSSIPSSSIYNSPPCSKYFTQLFSRPGCIPTALVIPQVEQILEVKNDY